MLFDLFEGHDVIIESLSNLQWSSIAALFYLAFFASIIGYSLWSYLLSKYPAGQIAPLTLGVPVVGLSSAALLLGETISWQQGLGITLVLLGLMINVVARMIL